MYGERGVPHQANTPQPQANAALAMDPSNDLLIYGGSVRACGPRAVLCCALLRVCMLSCALALLRADDSLAVLQCFVCCC